MVNAARVARRSGTARTMGIAPAGWRTAVTRPRTSSAGTTRSSQGSAKDDASSRAWSWRRLTGRRRRRGTFAPPPCDALIAGKRTRNPVRMPRKIRTTSRATPRPSPPATSAGPAKPAPTASARAAIRTTKLRTTWTAKPPQARIAAPRPRRRLKRTALTRVRQRSQRKARGRRRLTLPATRAPRPSPRRHPRPRRRPRRCPPGSGRPPRRRAAPPSPPAPPACRGG